MRSVLQSIISFQLPLINIPIMGLVAVEIMLHLILGTPGMTVDTVLDKILLELLHSWH